MVEVNVSILAICLMFGGYGIATVIKDVIEFIKKGRWYISVSLIVILVTGYFVEVKVFECLDLVN